MKDFEMNLPPLPEPACSNRDLFTDEITQTFYTESQLREYAAQVVEACAKVACGEVMFNGGSVQMEAHVRQAIMELK